MCCGLLGESESEEVNNKNLSVHLLRVDVLRQVAKASYDPTFLLQYNQTNCQYVNTYLF